MNKLYGALVLLAILAIFGIFFAKLFGGEDAWICQDGQWVKHGNPGAAEPETGCGIDGENQGQTGENDQKDEEAVISVESPASGSKVNSPLAIKGKARGNWFFEASFPVKIIDKQGNTLASGIATAEGDWMTEDFVPFSAELEFEAAAETEADLVLSKDNPSGLPENDAEVAIPLTLTPGDEKITVDVHFMNTKEDPEVSDCGKTFPVKREIGKTEAVGRAAVEELLKGPTTEEKALGYSTSINEGVKVNSLAIENGTAKIDFDDRLQYQVGGSCRVASIRYQIINTLKQFPAVSEVIISVNGETEEILQP